MALLFVDSFDHYQAAEVTAKWTGAQFGPEIHAGKGRCGTAGLSMEAPVEVFRGIPFGSDTVTVGFAFLLQEAGTDPNRDFTILYLKNYKGLGGQLATLSKLGDGSLSVSVGNGDLFVGQTPPNTIHHDVWYYLEWKVTFHASAGAMILRVNNIPRITVSGIDTLTASGEGLPARQIYFLSSSFLGLQHYYIDDLYVLDSTGPAPWNDFLGDSKVEYLRPRAPGASQSWTPIGTSGSHWLAVDDNATPDEDSTYVEANAPALTDTNRYQPTGLPSGPIFGAQLSLYAKKSEVGPRVIAPVVNGVSGPHLGPSADAYQYYSTPYSLNPATGNPWTIAEINAIEAGVTVIS